MNFLKMFDKLDDIIYEPIKLVTDWAREPLKGREHKRTLEKEEARVRTAAEVRIYEEKERARIAVMRQTEVKRILDELDEIRKDKEFERMKGVSEAIIKYQERLSRLSTESIEAIGNIQLELWHKAQSLVEEKVQQYKRIQDEAKEQAIKELKLIESEFPNNEQAKEILYKSVDASLVNIISTASDFIDELKRDIVLWNKNIHMLADKNQEFIKNLLEKFYVGGELEYAEEVKKLK